MGEEVEVEPVSERETVEEAPPIFDLRDMLSQMRGGKLTAADAAVLIAMINQIDEAQWRRFRYEAEKEKKEKPNPQEIANIIREEISKVLPQKTEEIPDWAKEMQKQQTEILSRLKKEEEEKEKQELISKAQEPIKHLEAEIKSLEGKLKELSVQPMTEEAKSELKKIKETLSEVKETAQLMGMKEPESEKPKTTMGQYNIPISGSIPAYAIFIPEVIEQIMKSVEARAEKFGLLFSPSQPPTRLEPTEPLIKLPEMPEPTPEPTIIEIPPTPTPEEKPVLIKMPPKEKRYKCKICGETFEKPIQLARHVKKCRKKVEKSGEETN